MFDFLDYLGFVLKIATILSILFLVVFVLASNDRTEKNTECNKKGGELIEVKRGYICIDKNNIFKLN